MLKRVVKVLACWKEDFDNHHSVNVWEPCLIGLCGPFCHTFDGIERSVVELKMYLLCSIFVWLAALVSHSFSRLCSSQRNKYFKGRK